MVHAASRPKLVASRVSHCLTQSHREKYTRELAKHIDVSIVSIKQCHDDLSCKHFIFQIDIFGNCGWNCKSVHECVDYLAYGYKFFLAFENSICPDYISEKFFNCFKHNLVPVVMGNKICVNETF